VSRYRFEAARPDGEVVRGMLRAASAADVLADVTGRGLVLLAVRELAAPPARRLPPRDLALFFRSLSTLLIAGIPLDRALHATAGPGRLRDVVADLRARVQEGSSLSAALAAQPGMPGLVVGLVRAGEGVGGGAGLEEAARQLERDAELRSRLTAALAYPVVLLIAGTGAVAVLVLTVLPRFVALLGDAGAALPTSTRWLLAGAAVMRAHGAILSVVALVLGALATRWLRSAAGHEALLQTPGIGALRLGFATARAARALGALLEGGAPALRALAAAGEAAGDRALAARIARAAERVRTGASLGVALSAERALSAQALELARAGEQAGRLPPLLVHAADAAEAEATRQLHALVQLIEPGLILVFGAVVGFVALALLQAVYGLRIR
jgi:general secretion pathway protein F